VAKLKLKSKIAEQIKKSGFTREFIVQKFEDLEEDSNTKKQNKGVNLQTISNWCTGRSKPNVYRLFLLAKILKCKVDDFYDWVE
jgi:transcriptional regulator with XRE-family HTH domain